MRAPLALLLVVILVRTAESAPSRTTCTAGAWHIEWDAKNGGGSFDIAIDPAHPRLTLGPDRDFGATVISFDPASCRIDVLVLTEIRRGAEGFEDEDNTLRLTFTAGRGARSVTGEYERNVFDPRSQTKGKVKGVARKAAP